MMNPFDSDKISTIEKIFLAGVASAILKKNSKIKVRGSPHEILVLQRALRAAMNLNDELHRPGATVESITTYINAKHEAAAEFAQCFGVQFPV